jgi:hypothetical protein
MTPAAAESQTYRSNDVCLGTRLTKPPAPPDGLQILARQLLIQASCARPARPERTVQ